MSWEKREILIVVKTYPARSKKYGNTVCTAGILEDTNEWIRIYPIRWEKFKRANLKKFTRIRAKVKKDSDYLSRKESHKIKESSIKVIDDSLTNAGRKGVWEERTKIIQSVISKSAEDLVNDYKIDRTSLGVIRPNLQSVKFRLRKNIEDIEIEKESTIQVDLFGKQINKVDLIEKAFSYEFKCDTTECNGHDKICEDWELMEAFRSWRKIYRDDSVFKEKLIEKFQNFMVGRDLHFILGTTWRFPKWIIIGLFYPPN